MAALAKTPMEGDEKTFLTRFMNVPLPTPSTLWVPAWGDIRGTPSYASPRASIFSWVRGGRMSPHRLEGGGR
jgi:hypothetical protein